MLKQAYEAGWAEALEKLALSPKLLRRAGKAADKAVKTDLKNADKASHIPYHRLEKNFLNDSVKHQKQKRLFKDEAFRRKTPGRSYANSLKNYREDAMAGSPGTKLRDAHHQAMEDRWGK